MTSVQGPNHITRVATSRKSSIQRASSHSFHLPNYVFWNSGSLSVPCQKYHPFSLHLTSTLYNQASAGCFNLQPPLFRIWCGQVAIKNHWLLLCRTGFLAVKPNNLVSTGRVENWSAWYPSRLSACHVVKSKLIRTRRTSPNEWSTYDAYTMIQ